MRTIHNLATQNNSDTFVTMVENFLKVHVMLFYAILNELKKKRYAYTMCKNYKQCTGQSKIDQIYSFLLGFCPNFFEYFN